MDGQSLKRQVFISHASDDPEWPREELENLEAEFASIGVDVCLDERHKTSTAHVMAGNEWLIWMDEQLDCSAVIISLWSSAYANAWNMNPDDRMRYGLAHEVSWIRSFLKNKKYQAKGRVVFLVKDVDAINSIPFAYRGAVGIYCRHNQKEMGELLGRFAESLTKKCSTKAALSNNNEGRAGDGVASRNEADLGASGYENGAEHASADASNDPTEVSSAESINGNGATPKDAAGTQKSSDPVLSHQAREAADRVRRCPELLLGFSACTNSDDCLGRALPDSADEMVRELMRLDPDALQNVMQAFCAAFGELAEREQDAQARKLMAQATVAMYLLCVCRLIHVQSPVHLSGIPRLDSDHAANLFASLIATVMAGGKLVLKTDHVRKRFVPEHCYAIQWRSVPDIDLPSIFGEGLTITPKDQFERELYLAVFHDELTPVEALEVGKISPQQRANLSKRLRYLRGLGRLKISMSVVLFAPVPPRDVDTSLVRPFGIPVFNLFDPATIDPGIAYELLGGQSAEDLIAMLGELLRAVGKDIDALGPSSTDRPNNAKEVIDRLQKELKDLAESSPEDPRVAKIKRFLDSLETSNADADPQQPDVLTRSSDFMDKLSRIAESGQKLIPYLISLLP